MLPSLPIILLRLVVDRLDHMIDIISLVLTCKRLYNDMKRYVRLDPKYVGVRTLLPLLRNNIVMPATTMSCTILSSVLTFGVNDHGNNYLSIPQHKPNAQPSSTNKLSLGYNIYNVESVLATSDPLPPTLTYLIYSDNFNQPLTCLPALIELTFGYKFNQHITLWSLPATLKRLTFGYNFNKPLAPHVLPAGLVGLTFGYHFDQPITEEVLPPALRYLTFGWCFNKVLVPGVLPASLRRLIFIYYFNHLIKPGTLPDSLQELKFGYEYNQELDPGILPLTLQSLSFGYFFDQEIQQHSLPTSLTELNFGYSFNMPIAPGSLPASLRRLTFDLFFNQQVEPGALPAGVTDLSFGFHFNQEIGDGRLPPALTKLKLGWCFDKQILPGTLPSSITNLTIGRCFQEEVPPDLLPASLTELTMNSLFCDRDLEEIFPTLPPNMYKLNLISMVAEVDINTHTIKDLPYHSSIQDYCIIDENKQSSIYIRIMDRSKHVTLVLADNMEGYLCNTRTVFKVPSKWTAFSKFISNGLKSIRHHPSVKS
ncbi:hypothetical protein SAMD00019534_018360, partial [Acytostelium subglobosum LB1]|uniref:hypothetical protein n=1 Tax=Acytostelium subglobosum LB1 TaxID=1410327 RepID=UPI000644CE2D